MADVLVLGAGMTDLATAMLLAKDGHDVTVLERQVADLSRPGALAASLSWYRANFSPETFLVDERPALPPVRCPTMGIWSSGDVALTEQQMTGSARFVEGGRWRYERLEDVDHWIPVRAAQSLNELLLDFFSEG